MVAVVPNFVNVSDEFSWHHLVVLQKYMGGNCMRVHHLLQMTKRASMFFVMVCPSFCTVARAERGWTSDGTAMLGQSP